MKHSTIYATNVAPNCFKTVIHDEGISRFYSVCVKDIFDLAAIDYNYSARGIQRSSDYSIHSFVRVWSVVDRDIYYYQRPYKNVKFEEFHRRGRYIIFECYSSFRDTYKVSYCVGEDKRVIRNFLEEFMVYHPKK